MQNSQLSKLYDEIVKSCPLCHGTNSACSCANTYKFELSKVQANIPIKLCKVAYKDFSLSEAHNKTINDFIARNIPCLYLEQGSKLLRTKLMAYILSECLRNKQSSYFIDSYDAAQLFSGKWFEKVGAEYQKLMGYDVVGFNDVGDEHKLTSEVVHDAFDYILKERIYAEKQTIISSSMTIEIFAQKYTKDRKELLAENVKVLSFPNETLTNIFKDIRVG